MKTRSILFGLSVCAAMCACTDNDVTGTGSEQQVSADGKAYMVVNIQDVGSTGSRATAGDPEFEYGTADEHAVADAYFYFYDDSGMFVTEATVWNGGTAYTPEGSQTSSTIEYESSTVIVLDNLNSTGYPKYMVTVLNKPADFDPEGTTLDTMLEKLSMPNSTDGGYLVSKTINDESTNCFVMSTTSYGETKPYFVTELTPDDFYLEPIDMDAIDKGDVVPVDVYVERLAAKVTLNINDDSDTVHKISDGVYKIEATVAGDPNNQGSTYEGATDLYIKIGGWHLNATAKYSYMSKNIDTGWTDAKLGFTWNAPNNYRSYWGMAYNYDVADYPDSSGGNNDDDENGTGGADPLNYYLKYTNLENPTDLVSDEYCAENTISGAILASMLENKKNTSSAFTSVLMSAQLCEEDGTPTTKDYVRFEGMLWEKDSYLDYALSYMYSSNHGLEGVYYYDGTIEGSESEKYVQLDSSYFDLDTGVEDTNHYYVDGAVCVVSNKEKDLPATLYVADPENEGSFIEAREGIVQTALDAFNDYAYKKEGHAIGYKEGRMYYNIPIEHLNDDYDNGLQEANYGVVRNHHYVLTIIQLAGLGKGIFDPDEVIVPNDEDDNPNNYYVAAKVNILSWKLVEQSVNL